MNSINGQDVLLSIDMDEMGIRPFDWIDINKNIDFDDVTNDFFNKEKTVDFTVYSAELKYFNDGKKITTNEEEKLMSADDDDDDDDDDNGNDYEIDPETGEKIFREAAFASNTALPLPDDKWIAEYLSNIESSSNRTTTSNNSELLLENIPFSLLENPDEQINLIDSEWLSNLIDLDNNSDNMFTDSMILNSNENKSDQTSPIYVSLSNENNSTTNNHSSISIEDEYSTSSSSNSSRRQRLYSSLESDNEIAFIETKLEKNDRDENLMSHIMTRRASTRSHNQGQQDEDALHQYNIPLTLNDITQSSTEEYNRHLACLSHLSAEQIHIIKDIRRRGKNKVAAQNCRKRKAFSVETLSEEVDELKRVKYELEEQKRAFQQQIAETRSQYEYLHRQILPDRQLPPAIIVK